MSSSNNKNGCPELLGNDFFFNKLLDNASEIAYCKGKENALADALSCQLTEGSVVVISMLQLLFFTTLKKSVQRIEKLNIYIYMLQRQDDPMTVSVDSRFTLQRS